MEAERRAMTHPRSYSWKGQSWDLHLGLSGIKTLRLLPLSVFSFSPGPLLFQVALLAIFLISFFPRPSCWRSPCWAQAGENAMPRDPGAAPVYVLCWVSELLTSSPCYLTSNLHDLGRRSPWGLMVVIANRCPALHAHIHSPSELGRLKYFMSVAPFLGSWVLL